MPLAAPMTCLTLSRPTTGLRSALASRTTSSASAAAKAAASLAANALVQGWGSTSSVGVVLAVSLMGIAPVCTAGRSGVMTACPNHEISITPLLMSASDHPEGHHEAPQ